ncbi:hypothetical protein HRI_002097300 [Hibiscus trionum]|uniref:Uncharacterized protein n=1 Tax=Hibiscus trionum TaxID=183268 RepID=A0A9W7HYI4_HIBTR|nr:hypothetical protein HRI_002097300 [Hibiscus trionum]
MAEGTTVVVKRLKDVAVYYSQHEKLLVSDFMPNGSLSALLHGSRVLGRTPLHWDSINAVQEDQDYIKGLEV